MVLPWLPALERPMMLVLNLSRSYNSRPFTLLSHAEARAYLGGDGAQKELCSVALTD
jgi:hypothetical protein